MIPPAIQQIHQMRIAAGALSACQSLGLALAFQMSRTVI